LTRQKLLQFGWNVLPHSPYSLDIASSDFHLFRSLQNSLIEKNVTPLKDYKKHLEQFFVYKTRKFWEDEIFKLSERWRKVVEKNGKYIIE